MHAATVAATYTALLAAAAEVDWKTVVSSAPCWLHMVQDEALNQPVVVLLLQNLDPTNTEQLLLYMVWMLDTVAADRYSAVVLGQAAGASNLPSLSWLLELSSKLPDKYRDNLTSIYMVDASIGIRTMLTCASPFVSDSLTAKLRSVEDCDQLAHLDHKVGHCCQLLLDSVK